MIKGRLNNFWASINNSMHTVKDTMTSERFADGQRSHDLKRMNMSLQEKVSEQEQRLATIGEQMGLVDFELSGK